MAAPNFPCPLAMPKPRVVRPSWYSTGTPVVTDPQYGAVSLLRCPQPLRCFKSERLPDGSYWMWLGEAWHAAARSPLSGALFFATSWEYWVLLLYQSCKDETGISTWKGTSGNGRMTAKVATITALP